jgi:MFS family permease
MSSTVRTVTSRRDEASPTGLRPRFRLGERLGAFAYRDYRLMFAGQAISAVGGWMQMVAQGWLVYALTGSAFYLGLVAFARAVPVFVFSLIGGALADRADRRLVIAVAVVGTFRGRGLVVALSCVVFGVALCTFAVSVSMAFSLVAAAVLGLCGTYSSIAANTMLQTHSDARMRGRVMGLHGMTMMGIVPLGAMLEGSIGSTMGVPNVLIVGGVLTATASLLIAVRSSGLRDLE